MVNRILSFAVHQRLLVLIGTALLVVFGLLALRQIPSDAFPDVTNVQVQVLATSGGMSPPEVEKLITRPIEVELAGLPRLTEVRSVSKIGLAAITVVFEDGVDDYFARQLVSERSPRAEAFYWVTILFSQIGDLDAADALHPAHALQRLRAHGAAAQVRLARASQDHRARARRGVRARARVRSKERCAGRARGSGGSRAGRRAGSSAGGSDRERHG